MTIMLSVRHSELVQMLGA